MKREKTACFLLALALPFFSIPLGWETVGWSEQNVIALASAQDAELDADDSMDLEEDLEGNTMGGFQDSESGNDDWKPMMKEGDPDSLGETLETGE